MQSLQHHDTAQVNSFFVEHIQHLGFGLGAKGMV